MPPRPLLFALVVCCAMSAMTCGGTIESVEHGVTTDAAAGDASDASAHLDVSRDGKLVGDTSHDGEIVRDTSRDDNPVLDAPPDVIPPDGLTCPLSHEECLGVLRGCYMDPCDHLDCSMAGCETDVADPDYVIMGYDRCGGGWVVLGDSANRLGTTDVTTTGPYGTIEFTVTLDGAPTTTRCNVISLPTGAIRYRMHCEQDGQGVYAAVLEGPGAHDCHSCPNVAGCYDVVAQPDICGFLPCPVLPERIRLDGDVGCSIQLRAEEAPAGSIRGWVAHHGVLTIEASVYPQPANEYFTCSLLPTGNGGFDSAVCIVADGPPTPVDGVLHPAADSVCALPQCLSSATCETHRLGDACVDGACTCDGGPACVPGEGCAPGHGCVDEALLDDPRACTTDAHCNPCLVGETPVCCDQIIDGSALDAVNIYHTCPMCCSCSQPCPPWLPFVSGVSCVQGRCRYDL